MGNEARALRSVSLDDKWIVEKGRLFLTAKQALARVPLLQKELDRRAGLDTTGFISGYPGSPLGTFDLELARIRDRLDAEDIVFKPGLNEDLAATAVWGTQQATLLPGQKRDGIFAIWYAKGPGFDRASDAFKHANLAGTARHGGVLLLVGDDHPGKSSGAAFQTDLSLAALGIPVLYPATIDEFIAYGLHGIAMSRESGLYVALKCVNETVDATASIDFDLAEFKSIPPKEPPPVGGVNIRFELLAVAAQDRRLVRERLPRAAGYVRANQLDRLAFGAAVPHTLGIVTAGKAYQDVMGALARLSIDQALADTLGIGVLKLAMIYPVEPTRISAFAQAARELFVIEEKRPQIEPQLASLIVNRAHRPMLIGKIDPEGRMLLPSDEPLTSLGVAVALAGRIEALVPDVPKPLATAIAEVRRLAGVVPKPGPSTRVVNYCSGCPHNTSTVIPEGGVVMTGTGCHSLVQMLERTDVPVTQMGGEGANWIGIEPFTDAGHGFVNMGDGTYNHSGSLAVRAAVQAGSKMTFRILFNGVIAMTGGQAIENGPDPVRVVDQLLAEGVSRVFVVSDDPDSLTIRVRDKVEIADRADLASIHARCIETTGVSVVLYVQRCATEKRRDRKRGRLAEATQRVIINDLVCEACGDCSVQSNCMSIVPVATEFGVKRAIDQASCNSDFSCLRGFCPSFVTVEGVLRRSRASELDVVALARDLPDPVLHPLGDSYNILIAGVGGTGAVTFGSILAMAAHLDHRGSTAYDMTGLAQKGGAVYSHIRILPSPATVRPARIGVGEADILFGCDLVAATQGEGVQALAPGRSHAIVDSEITPTAEFHKQRDLRFENEIYVAALRRALPQEDGVISLDASGLARRHFDDPLMANMILLGYAAQAGWLPVPARAIERAIELNGTGVAKNITALAIGRILRARPDALVVPEAAAQHLAETLDEAVARRGAELEAYQDRRYCDRYIRLVAEARAADVRLDDDAQSFGWAVARNAFKVMAYKDEYEVARLYTDGRFGASINEQFEPSAKLSFLLAPPILARHDPATGRPRKISFGPWMTPAFRLLAKFKWLRRSRFDPFGMTGERRKERLLRDSYLESVTTIAREVTVSTRERALMIARLPEEVRGFGPVKLPGLDAALSILNDDWRGVVAAQANGNVTPTPIHAKTIT